MFSQAFKSQTTLSQHSSPKAYNPWQKEDIERLIGWIEDHVNLMQGKPSEWTKRAKEVFSLDNHISTTKIRDKARNMRTAYNRAKQMQLQSGWRLTVEDVEQSIHDRLEKICQFFWRLDRIWGQKPNTTPLSQFDSLAPEAPDSDIMIDISLASPAPSGPSLSQFLSLGLPPMSSRLLNIFDNDDSDQPENISSQQFVTHSGSTGNSEPGLAHHSRSTSRQTQRHAQKSAGSDFTEKMLEAQLAQRERLHNQRLKHEREMHTATLASQERVAEIIARSHEQIAASSERTVQAVLAALTSYRRRSDSSRRTRSRSRSASPARHEA